uniref:RING domain protein n=1 Tax=Mimivirus LCMiAC01 TaxID=2506608 RepID=A0A481Z048_9VIRU|nr:MAG: RING domain protein [Mimivirus LCMiAC01]
MYPRRDIRTVRPLIPQQINEKNFDFIQKNQQSMYHKLNYQLYTIKKDIGQQYTDYVYKYQYIQLEKDANNIETLLTKVRDNFKILEEYIIENTTEDNTTEDNTTEDNICYICNDSPNNVVLPCSIHHRVCINCVRELNRCPFCRASF